MKRKIVIIVVIILLIIVLSVIYKNYKNSKRIEITTGTIEALEVDVRSKITDRIDTLFSEEGDAVKKGDILGRFEGKEIESIVQQAKAAVQAQKTVLIEIESNIKNTKKLLERVESLKEVGGISKQSIEDLELKLSLLKHKKEAQMSLLKQAEENLRLVKLKQKEITITTPISGIVVSKNFEKGELIPQGASIFTIADYKNLWLNVYLSLKDVERIKLSQAVYIRLDAFPRKRFRGRIVYISKDAEFTPKTVLSRKNRENLVFRVKVKIEEGFDILRPGLPVEVIISG